MKTLKVRGLSDLKVEKTDSSNVLRRLYWHERVIPFVLTLTILLLLTLPIIYIGYLTYTFISIINLFICSYFCLWYNQGVILLEVINDQIEMKEYSPKILIEYFWESKFFHKQTEKFEISLGVFNQDLGHLKLISCSALSPTKKCLWKELAFSSGNKYKNFGEVSKCM